MKGIQQFRKMKEANEPIAMVTAYDHPTAHYAERAGVDTILVGDSLGMVVLGYPSTAYVTVDDMIHHGKAVRRGAPNTFIVLDMPFGSYHESKEKTIEAAVRMYQETRADALKVEGAGEVIERIAELTTVGIPVVAHLGLLPQSAAVEGAYRVQGKTASQAMQLIADAKACERAGAVMLVVECIPHELAQKVTEAVSIPVIGIGAGAETDGQVLVVHDLAQIGDHRLPKFVETYSDAGRALEEGIAAYTEAVHTRQFPKEEHQFTMSEEERLQLYGGDNDDSNH